MSERVVIPSDSDIASIAPHQMIERLQMAGLVYEDYLASWEAHIAMPLKGLDKTRRKYLFYAKYNGERAGRVEAAYEMDQRFKKQLASIDAPQYWMILTEDWCVDSAYALPIISAAALHNRHVIMRILLRDEHLDIMDQYLTDGGRSIPKLIAFDPAGNELFTWGPRPQALKTLRNRWKEEGLDGAVISKNSVDWYDAGGWRGVESELIEALADFEV